MNIVPQPKNRSFHLSKIFNFGEGASLWEPLTHLRSWNTFLWIAIVLGAGLWLLVWRIPTN